MIQMTEVRYEPCLDFEADPDDAHDVCQHCGWLDDEHWLAPVIDIRSEPSLLRAS